MKTSHIALIVIASVLLFFSLLVIAIISENPSAKMAATQSPDLELGAWHSERTYDWMTTEGEVKNISNVRLQHVQACVVWRDAAGNFITSDDALVEYDPIMPGQTSPFKVNTRYNPVMQTVEISFRFLGGREIKFSRRK